MARASGAANRGFTLLEVLVALVLMGMIMVLALGAFQIGVHTWQRGEGTVQEYEKGSQVYEQLSQDLRSAFLSPEKPEIDFVGSSSEVSFVCTTSGLTSFTTAWRRVSYSVEEDKGLALREEDPWLANPSVLHLDPQVKSLSFSYLEELQEDGEQSWVESWDSRKKHKLPQAVKVTLHYDKEGREDDNEASGASSFVVALPVNVLSEGDGGVTGDTGDDQEG